MKIFWMVQVSLLCSNITQYNFSIFSVWLLGNSVIVPQLSQCRCGVCVHTQTHHTCVNPLAPTQTHQITSFFQSFHSDGDSANLMSSGVSHQNIREGGEENKIDQSLEHFNWPINAISSCFQQSLLCSRNVGFFDFNQ